MKNYIADEAFSKVHYIRGRHSGIRCGRESCSAAPHKVCFRRRLNRIGLYAEINQIKTA